MGNSSLLGVVIIPCGYGIPLREGNYANFGDIPPGSLAWPSVRMGNSSLLGVRMTHCGYGMSLREHNYANFRDIPLPLS
jgi:hypothetical protein